jgi:hypothetical protein
MGDIGFGESHRQTGPFASPRRDGRARSASEVGMMFSMPAGIRIHRGLTRFKRMDGTSKKASPKKIC